jgi:hypothetical protein
MLPNLTGKEIRLPIDPMMAGSSSTHSLDIGISPCPRSPSVSSSVSASSWAVLAGRRHAVHEGRLIDLT